MSGITNMHSDGAPLPRYLRLPSLLVMAAVSGVLLLLAFPPVDMGPLAWVALVPLFLALSQTRTVLQAALCGLVFGAVFMGHYALFLLPFGAFPWGAAVVYQALFYLAFGVGAGPAMRLKSPLWRVLGGASAWVLVVFLRAHFLLPFTGGDLAYSQYDQVPLIQMVSIIGQFGLTFIMAAVNAALSQALLAIMPFPFLRPATDLKQWANFAAKVAVGCYLVVILGYMWGALVIRLRPSELGTGAEVAVVQGNTSPRGKVTSETVERARETYVRLNSTLPKDVDLTIWPEAAFPTYMQWWPNLEQTASDAARHTDGYLLTGALEALGDTYYNAALLYSPEGELVDKYHKMDLVAFGEFVPYREQLKFLERYPIRERDFSPGDARSIMDVNGVRYAPLICFEGIFSEPSREVCDLGAQVLIIITGDPWPINTVEPAQHSRMAPFRAVESRRYLCRAAISGESAIYDPYGQKLAEVPLFTEGVAQETVYPRDTRTFFHRTGNMPLLILCCVLYLMAFWKGDD